MLVRESRYWRWLFHCEPVRGPLICRDGACAGRLRRRYPPCQAAGTPLAALPAVLWVAAHDSRPASYPANVACNSPDTVPHRAPILLELQRLRPLLKIHSIELHAKPPRARASCLRSSPHTWTRHLARGPSKPCVGPTFRTWVRRYARGRRPRASLGVGVRVTGLTRIVSGSRAARQVRRRCAHNADHLAHDTPLSAFVTEVVCDLGATLPRGATSPTVNGGIAPLEARHADDTPKGYS